MMPQPGMPPGGPPMPPPGMPPPGGPPPGPQGPAKPPPPPNMAALPTHDVTIVRARKYGCCKVEPVPPEEFGVGRNAKLGQPLDYCFHAVRKTQAALIKQGFDADQIKELPTASSVKTTEESKRDTVDESQKGDGNDLNRSNRMIAVTEHYAIIDYEGDGKARLYRVTTGGDSPSDIQVLRRDGKPDIEPIDFDPFASITPFIVTHRFFGKSVADLVIEIQRIKTSLQRALLDNAYLANNQRLEVAESHAHAKTLDDILDNRIGGVVRSRQPGGILPIPNQSIGDFVFPLIEYMDATREWRTGVTRQGQGLDPDALQNIGEQAVIRAQNSAMEKTKLIARIFAETGFKDLFWKIHATVRKNETSQPTARLRNKWVTVDPRQWRRRDDMTVSVGLGGGSKTEQLVFWGQVLTFQKEAMEAQSGLTKPDQIYNSLKKFMELGGERAVDRYWTNPAENPPAPPPPTPEEQEVQGKLKIKQAEVQGNQQMQQVKLQADQQAQVAKLQGERAKMQAQHQLEQQRMQAEFQMKAQQMQAEFALKQRQMEMEMQLEREGMAIDAAVQVKTAPVRMGGAVG